MQAKNIFDKKMFLMWSNCKTIGWTSKFQTFYKQCLIVWQGPLCRIPWKGVFRKLTNLTAALYISINVSLSDISLISKEVPEKLSWRAMYIPRSWKIKNKHLSKQSIVFKWYDNNHVSLRGLTIGPGRNVTLIYLPTFISMATISIAPTPLKQKTKKSA